MFGSAHKSSQNSDSPQLCFLLWPQRQCSTSSRVTQFVYRGMFSKKKKERIIEDILSLSLLFLSKYFLESLKVHWNSCNPFQFKDNIISHCLGGPKVFNPSHTRRYLFYFQCFIFKNKNVPLLDKPRAARFKGFPIFYFKWLQQVILSFQMKGFWDIRTLLSWGWGFSWVI